VDGIRGGVRLQQPPLLLLVSASVCLLGVVLFAMAGRGAHHEPVLYVLAALFGSIDLGDLILRLYFRRVHTRASRGDQVAATSVPLEIGEFTPYQVHHHLAPYAIVVSVYNAEEELDGFLEAMHPYREHLWVIDDASTDETFARLEQAGVRCVRGGVNRKKPGALKELVAVLDPEIVTVVVVDPDTRIVDSRARSSSLPDLERVIFEFQRSGMAALCPRLVIRAEGLLARFQQLEFWLSFTIGRHSLGDHCVTSGIAIYRRDALVGVLHRHSLSVYAEDLKNAYLLLVDGEQIYYDNRLTVETSGKRTWHSWFSQRVAWHFGLLKVYTENFRDLLNWSEGNFFMGYHFIFYTGVLGILMHPLKLLTFFVVTASLAGGLDQVLGLGLIPRTAVTEPAYFLIAYGQCAVLLVLALASAQEEPRRLAHFVPIVPLYFFYSLVHTIPVTVGYMNWFTLSISGRRLYRDHFQDDATLRRQFSQGRS
jgi:cellulose synthase/poly-beta-1,6-N-acetylglucosamine synthase-like glycosyltransferase